MNLLNLVLIILMTQFQNIHFNGMFFCYFNTDFFWKSFDISTRRKGYQYIKIKERQNYKLVEERDKRYENV